MSNPILSIRYGDEPEFIGDNLYDNLQSDKVDYQSYINERSKHSIILERDQIIKDKTLNIGVANPNFDSGPIEYTITIIQSNEEICPFDCSMRGACVSLDNCLCYFPNIGRDCGLIYSPININDNATAIVLNDRISYLGIDLSQSNYYPATADEIRISCY